MCHGCVFCNSYRVDSEIVLVKIGFGKTPRTFEVVPSSYSGIRAICRTCLEGLKSMPVPEMEVS